MNLKKPPMGWNSYDYYDTTVNEEQVRGNADYMAAHLKEYGWEYVVVDIAWYSYETGEQRERFQYVPFCHVEMDEYSRLLPCVKRFPSSADGKGFGPLADYVHGLGLKFGIHIMRGIPRQAAYLFMRTGELILLNVTTSVVWMQIPPKRRLKCFIGRLKNVAEILY